MTIDQRNFDDYFDSLNKGLDVLGNITDAASPEDQMVINGKNVSSVCIFFPPRVFCARVGVEYDAIAFFVFF